MISAAALHFNTLGRGFSKKSAFFKKSVLKKDTINPQLTKTLELLKGSRDGGSRVRRIVQIFGKNHEHFRTAINFLQENGFVNKKNYCEININMGCPANKILKNGEGVALMSNPALAHEIIKTCADTAKVPVSVKMRLGPGKGFDCAAFAKMCQEAGAVRLIVHARYAEQGFGGGADWEKIGEIVKAVSIPVIANGDIKTKDDMEKCLGITKAHGVMLGRALIGAPWRISGSEYGIRKIRKIVKYHADRHKKCGHKTHEMNKHMLLYKKYL
jgi:tRNA-dihydrouridine synthase